MSLISSSTENYSTIEDSKFEVLVVAGLNVRIVKDFFINLDWRHELDSHLPVVGLA
jgi:hypothetical protein